MGITVRLQRGAQGCYACITDNTEGNFKALDVLLPAGKGACTALEEVEAEFREQAARLLRNAELCRIAADQI